MGAKPASLPEKCNLGAEDAAQGQCLLCASRISLPTLRNVFGNPAQTQHRLKGCLLGSWQMLQETLVGGTHRFLILPAFLGSVLSRTARSVRGRMVSCFKTGVPVWQNNKKKTAFSSKNASVHSCKVLLHHCQAGNLRGAAPKHLHADRSKFPLEGCSAVWKGMRCCGRNTACAPALCQQMESILP